MSTETAADIITIRNGSNDPMQTGNDQMNPGFQFKQFYVRHDRCAMKVGTDGVLLGAWTETPHLPCSVLDIGTGSGLVALMLAQRFPEAHIDAIDIDESAVNQAAENFAASPWSDRLHAYHSCLQDWQFVNGKCPNGKWYDLIVSNPPYFQNSLKNPDSGRKQARHTDTLSYEELFAHSTRLLRTGGRLALILPAEEEEHARLLADSNGLFLTRVTRVFSKESKPARRVLLCFYKPDSRNTDTSKQRDFVPPEDTLVLENEKGGRSAAYQELTKDFYL